MISVQSNLAHLKKYRVILKHVGMVEKIWKIENINFGLASKQIKGNKVVHSLNQLVKTLATKNSNSKVRSQVSQLQTFCRPQSTEYYK